MKKKKGTREENEEKLRASIAAVEEERRAREEAERNKKTPMTKEEWDKKQVNHLHLHLPGVNIQDFWLINQI